jgi:DNA-binding NarL/FixJ family response regulator
MRVLIVDDSPIIAQRVAAMLCEVSERVRIVGKAADHPGARHALSTLKPDLVVLDLNLPTGSGIEILEEVKRTPPSPVVIILTNYPYAPYRKRCRELGADFFFDKSTEFHQLPQAIRQLLDGCD